MSTSTKAWLLDLLDRQEEAARRCELPLESAPQQVSDEWRRFMARLYAARRLVEQGEDEPTSEGELAAASVDDAEMVAENARLRSEVEILRANIRALLCLHPEAMA